MAQLLGRPRTRIVTTLIVGTLLTSGCGKAAETGIEKMIEQQGGGDVDLDLDGDGGISIQTEEGAMTIDEDGNFVVTGKDGEQIVGQANGDDDGFSIESDDGSFSSGATTELPDDWPADVPKPAGLSIMSASSMSGDDGAAIQVSATTDDPAGFITRYTKQLEDAGLTSESPVEYAGEESWAAVFEGSYSVVLNVIAFPGEDPVVSIMVLSDS